MNCSINRKKINKGFDLIAFGFQKTFSPFGKGVQAGLLVPKPSFNFSK